MKRTLFFVLASLMAASCGKSSDNSSDIAEGQLPISLSPVASVITRSAIDGTVFPDSRTIVLSAYCNATSGTPANYFSDASFAKDGTTWSADKYWPSSGTLDFLAVSYDGLTPTLTTYDTKVSDGVTLVLPDNSSAQTDVLFASAQEQSYTDGGTPLSFMHACALIVFNAESSVAYDAQSNRGVTITKITLNNAGHSGRLAIKAEDTDGSWCTWSALSDRKDVDVPGITAYNVPAASEDLSLGIGCAGLIVPEQEQTSFTVYYTLHNGRDGSGGAADYSLQYTFACTGDWTEGRKYNYKIKFVVDGIVVNPTVTDWLAETVTPTVPDVVSVSYAVGGLSSVTLPRAAMTTGTEVMVDWGDGSVEAYTNATKAAVLDGDDIIFSHTYASAYTGDVNLCVRSGSLDFGKLKTADYTKFTVYDDIKVLVGEKPILLTGVFTVCDSPLKQVKFTCGNLMANVNADGTAVTEWKLADNQYDFIGNTTAQLQCRGGWVDLFGWTAEGKYSDGVKQYGINTSQSENDYSLNGSTGTPCDWGSLVGTGLSLLSQTEWEYLQTNALVKNSSGTNNFSIAGHNCAILKPDGFAGTVADSYTADEWLTAEAAGLVAIPFSGYRDNLLRNFSLVAHLWCSTNYCGVAVYYSSFSDNKTFVDYTGLHSGQSVRPVSVQ